jgi:hypothetical protein
VPENVYHGSELMVWWKCPKGDDHEWQALVSNRTRLKVGCSICAGKKIVNSNSMAILKPKLIKLWHSSKNGTLRPSDVSIASGKVVWWKCPKGDDHEWKSRVSHVVNGSNCPFCTLTPQSRQELTITFELKQFFNINPKGFKLKIDGKLFSIDIYLEELNIGIEFDGSYWHKDKSDFDKLKTNNLRREGFEIIRIREEPLKAITDIDIISKIPFDPKKVTNDILNFIVKDFKIENHKLDQINSYLRKTKIQNESALNDYIENILQEKAEVKKNKKIQ